MKEGFTKQINEQEFRQLPAGTEYMWEDKENKLFGYCLLVCNTKTHSKYNIINQPDTDNTNKIWYAGIKNTFKHCNIYIKQTKEMEKEIKAGQELKVLNKNTKKENTIKVVKVIDNVILYKGGWYDMDSIEILSIDGKSLKDDIQSYWDKFREYKNCENESKMCESCSFNSCDCYFEYTDNNLTTMQKLEFYKFIEKEINGEWKIENGKPVCIIDFDIDDFKIRKVSATSITGTFNFDDKTDNAKQFVEIIGEEELNNFFKQYLNIE